MRVLCGTDFSAFADDAAALAAHWSARAGADLYLIHACSHDEPLGPRRDRLTAEGRRLAALGASIAGLDVVVGEPAEVLVQEAEYRGADLIVLGAVGQREREPWFSGSVTVRVARDAAAPVLVAREIAPLKAWLGSGERLRVVTGFERGESTRCALGWVSRLGLTLQPEVEQQLLQELRARVEQVIGDLPARLMIRTAIGRRDGPW